MRALFEVIAGQLDTAKFPSRQGGTEDVPYYWFSGVDTDYYDQLIKVKVFRPKDLNRLNRIKKGDRLSLKFKNMKRDDRFEKCVIINVLEDDLKLYENDSKPETEQKLVA